MSEFTVNLPHKFNFFRHLGSEPSARILPEERELENPQNVAEIDEASIVEIGETSTSPAKVTSILQGAPLRAESVGARLRDEDCNLNMAEKDFFLTGSDDNVEDLDAFVTKGLQCLSEGKVEKLIGDESVNVEEILCQRVGFGEDGGYKTQSGSPNVTIGGDVLADERRFSPGQEINQILR